MNAPSLARTSPVAIINAWHSQGLRTLGHGQTLSRTHSCSKQPVLNTTRPLPSIVFVIYDCSGGARASYPGLWRIEHLLDLFTASANLDLSESDECRTTNNLDHHDSGPPHAGPVPSYGDHAIRILSPNPLPMPLRPLTLCFLTFHKNKPRCLRLDIQRTSSVMIMTECNWIKIQGLPCSNCEATSRQDNKC